MIAHTPEELALATDLFRIGFDAQDTVRRGVWRLSDLDDNQKNAWIAIARHILTNFTPRHEYAPQHGGGK